MVPAELATCRMGGRWPAAGEVGHRGIEAVELEPGEVPVVGIVSVGNGQVGPERAQHQTGVGRDGVGQ